MTRVRVISINGHEKKKISILSVLSYTLMVNIAGFAREWILLAELQ